MQAVRRFGQFTLGLKYAHYRADAFSDDTDKFWLWGNLSF